MYLTGRTRFRVSMTGKMILQVEEKIPVDSPGQWHHVWRDAKLEMFDMTEVKIIKFEF